MFLLVVLRPLAQSAIWVEHHMSDFAYVYWRHREGLSSVSGSIQSRIRVGLTWWWDDLWTEPIWKTVEPVITRKVFSQIPESLKWLGGVHVGWDRHRFYWNSKDQVSLLTHLDHAPKLLHIILGNSGSPWNPSSGNPHRGPCLFL